MKQDLDILVVANQLVRELGDNAPRASRCRLVELIAANNPRAAAFWRDVTRMCEEMLAAHRNKAGGPVDGSASEKPTIAA